MKVHHIGYAVKDIDKASAAFQLLGFKFLSGVTYDDERKVRIAFMINGNEVIELIEPDGDNSAVESVLKKNGPTPYHICYEVDSLEDSVSVLKKSGYIAIKKPQAASAINGRRVVFLMHKDLGIIELVEA